MRKIKIGILDFGYRSSNESGRKILQDVFDYISIADSLGISRYWLSEHHTANIKAPWRNPEMLLPILAGITKRIKVGAAGILINMHSPYRIALNFKLLSTLFSGRIDLGLAKGYADYNIMAYLLGSSGSDTESYEQKAKALIEFLTDEDSLLRKDVVISPYKGEAPVLWSLGTSQKGLGSSLKLGTNFCQSFFHFGADHNLDKDIISNYRKEFQTTYKREPQIVLAVSGYCSQNSQTATASIKKIKTKQPGWCVDNIVGSPQTFQDFFYEMQENYGINEFILLDMAESLKKRIKTIELLNKAFDL